MHIVLRKPAKNAVAVKCAVTGNSPHVAFAYPQVCNAKSQRLVLLVGPNEVT